jgi:hypothetical protein
MEKKIMRSASGNVLEGLRNTGNVVFRFMDKEAFMDNHLSSGGKVEITARFSSDFINDIDAMLKHSEMKSLEQQRSKFIEEALDDWYFHKWKA